MIELTFKLAEEGGESRDLLVRIHEPFRNPPEEEWPWAIHVEIDGRRSFTYGVDPLDAIESGARQVAIVLREVHGDAIEPIIEPRIIGG
jgi:hypothetical protein